MRCTGAKSPRMSDKLRNRALHSEGAKCSTHSWRFRIRASSELCAMHSFPGIQITRKFLLLNYSCCFEYNGCRRDGIEHYPGEAWL